MFPESKHRDKIHMVVFQEVELALGVYDAEVKETSL